MMMMMMMIKDDDDDEENGLALTPLSWQCAMMKAEYHWVVPCKAYSSSYILASIFLVIFIEFIMMIERAYSSSYILSSVFLVIFIELIMMIVLVSFSSPSSPPW